MQLSVYVVMNKLYVISSKISITDKSETIDFFPADLEDVAVVGNLGLTVTLVFS